MLGARAAMVAASGGMAAIRAGTAMGSAASSAYRLGQETSGSTGVGAGLGGIATAARGATREAARSAAERFTGPIRASAETGRDSAWRAGSRHAPSAADPVSAPTGADAHTAASGSDGAPGWARKLRTEQAARQHRHTAIQTVKEGDRPGAAANPDLSHKED